jgi:lipopolysaccharide transport system ATP-binding protein
MQPLIEVRNLSKRYELGETRAAYSSLREMLMGGGRKVPAGRTHEFWALRNVSFDVNQGDILGILGANGAGKSTLLKIIARITDPTAGEVRVRGRMASLLEVGSGFHPELTGRENVYLNGSILGMSRAEIDARLDEIVAFSGVEKFIDTPVKRYSSGMYVRLAFSIAAHLEPDILIADEVLAVGDAAFQKKCLGKMAEARSRARSVLFVSHNMAALESLCNRGVVLRQGEVIFSGPTREAIDFYQANAAETARTVRQPVIDLSAAPGRLSSYRPLLRRLELYSEDKPLTAGMRVGAPLRAVFRFLLENRTASFDITMGIHTGGGQLVCSASSTYDKNRVHAERSGEQQLICDIPSLPLLPGEYRLRVGLMVGGREVDYVEDAAEIEVIHSDYYGTGALPSRGIFVMENRWQLDG